MISTEHELDEMLSRPGPALIKSIQSVSSPLLILGAGGKMGPTLAVMARRAAEAAGHPLEVIAVSRFSDERARRFLENQGVRTIRGDLLEAAALEGLPDTENVIYLVGLKFGTAKSPSTTWAMNTVVPARVAERYPKARIVALSTGNVYPPSDVAAGGARETDPLLPLGEYANATVGRERVFEYYSLRQHTPVVLLRLFYAVELRYGVLADIARMVAAGESIDLTNGHFNCVWQGDANEAALRALALAASPPSVWNLCRPEVFSVRTIATELGGLLGRAPKFTGQESATALLGNAAPLCAKLGAPGTSMETVLRWTAHWVKNGGRSFDKPTHFEVRDGKY